MTKTIRRILTTIGLIGMAICGIAAQCSCSIDQEEYAPMMVNPANCRGRLICDNRNANCVCHGWAYTNDGGNVSSYPEMLKLAGFKVLAFEQFGSYQGEWIAHVSKGDVTGFIHGSYGSCSSCDSLEAQGMEQLAESYSDEPILTIAETVKLAESMERWEPGTIQFVKNCLDRHRELHQRRRQ